MEWLEDRLLLTSALEYLAKDATPVTLRLDSNVLEIVATGNPGTVLASKILDDIQQGVTIEGNGQDV